MSPVIRISEDTYKRLQGWAVPLEDTVESALQRVLNAADATRSAETGVPPAASRAPKPDPQEIRGGRGQITSESAYYARVLLMLHRMGGRGSKSEVVERIGAVLDERLSDADYETVASGEPRWENKVAWARNRLCELGYIRRGSPRGIWELTDEGKNVAESQDWPKGWSAPD